MKNFWKNKKVIVTGAAGFIGSNIINELISQGADVTGQVSLKKNNKLLRLQKKIQIVRCDLTDYKSCLKITKGKDIILNFAALDGSRFFKSQHSADIFKVNTQIVLNVLEAARINKLKRTLLMSSTEVYETDKNDGYIQSKKFAETAAMLYYKQYDMNISVARPGNTYGPGDATGKDKGRVVSTFISKSLNGEKIEIWGSGRQESSFLYVKDLVIGLMNLVEKYPRPDPIDLVSSAKISVLDLAKAIKKLTNNEKEIVFKEYNDLSIKRKKLSNRKAVKLIGFKEEVAFNEGLENTIKFYKDA